MSIGSPNPDHQLGSYRLLREIGRGAMGIVYEAISLLPADLAAGARLPPDRRVALKLLVFPPLLPPEEREALIVRFAREARALAAVRHPSVVDIYDVGEIEGQPYLAMEYLTGRNAREALLSDGPMPPERVIALGTQLCDALAAVHAAGIVHRDVKPDNLVLEPDGSIRLTDFGIARMEVEASLTRTGGLIGSPAYMAPEQIRGGTVDARADLFSAGVTLYQMLTGELPFQGASLMEVAHRVAYDPPRPLTGVDPGLAAVLLRVLEKDPDGRYPSAREMGQALIQTPDARRKALTQAPDARRPAPAMPGNFDSAVSAVGGWRLATGASLPAVDGAPDHSCFLHPQRAAIAWCAGCDRPLCGGCSRHREGQVWCPEHAAPLGRPAWLTRLEILALGLLFALLLWSLYPLHW